MEGDGRLRQSGYDLDILFLQCRKIWHTHGAPERTEAGFSKDFLGVEPLKLDKGKGPTRVLPLQPSKPAETTACIGLEGNK